MPGQSQIRHPSSADLALIALGDGTPHATERHLSRCATCSTTLQEFFRVLEAGRAGPARPALPPADVWEEIRRHL
ncbi:hypothetical protein [Streptomyces sp. KL116D]|uniref:hypothetical protein n=1 Tax=Streptomyces sp. KL116D TaxID=3045152 RepID=UPI0035592301